MYVVDYFILCLNNVLVWVWRWTNAVWHPTRLEFTLASLREPQTLRCLCHWQNLLGYSLYMKISTAVVIMSWSEIQQCHLLLWQEKLVVGNVTDKTWRGETVCQIFASNWLSTVEVPWKCPLLGTRSERVLCKGWMLVGKFVGLGLIILCKRWNGNKIFLKF